MTENKEKIEPCPLCGGEAEVVPWELGEVGMHTVVVRCKSCGFEGGPTEEADIAVFNWNDRNTTPAHAPCPLCGGSPCLDEVKGTLMITCEGCGAAVTMKLPPVTADVDYLRYGVTERAVWAKWDTRVNHEKNMNAAPLNAFVIDVPSGTFTHEEIENSIMDNYDDLPQMTFKAMEEGKPAIACVLPFLRG